MIYTGKWIVFKLKKGGGGYSFRLCYSLLVYSCIKYAILNVIWPTLNVIMCDTMSSRWAAELRGDFDESYLTNQNCVYVQSRSRIKQVSAKFDLFFFPKLEFISKQRLFVCV